MSPVRGSIRTSSGLWNCPFPTPSEPYFARKVPLVLNFWILEFSEIFNFEGAYSLIKPHIGSKLFLRARVMPLVENENEIYEKDVLRSHMINIKQIHSTWSDFRTWLHKFVLQNKREYSPINKDRPLLLILVGNNFRDRYFPDVWRNLLREQGSSESHKSQI